MKEWIAVGEFDGRSNWNDEDMGREAFVFLD
jgi:hypothetical protein